MATKIRMREPVILGHDTGLVEAGYALVLGLNWHAVVSKTPAKEVQYLAKSKGCSHYIHRKKTSVGLTSVSSKFKETLVSLSAIVASANPAVDAFLALALNDRQIWVCGFSNGLVLEGFDVVFEDIDDVVNKANEFKARYIDFKIWGDVEALEPSLGCDWSTLASLLASKQVLKDATLKEYKTNLGEVFSVFPKQAYWICGIGAAIIVGQKHIVPMVQDWRGKKAQAEIVVEDPQELWTFALKSSIAKTMISAPGSAFDIFATLEGLPLEVAGWKLKGAECEWSPIVLRCKATYNGTKRSHTNAAFESAKLPEWKTKWTLLKDVEVTFEGKTKPLPLLPKDFTSKGKVDLVLASEIQKLAPVLGSKENPFGQFAPMEVPQPKFATGEAVPKPLNFQIPLAASVFLKAPMRSFYAMPWLDQIAIKSVSMIVNKNTEINKASSTVELSLKGVIYANP